MAICFVLIRILPSHEYEVYNKLSKIQEIKELHPLFGEYDCIAKIEVEDFDKLGNIVFNKIRPIDGVTETDTLTGKKLK
jgi:DNA-binding Lrp family transcriptional regulator